MIESILTRKNVGIRGRVTVKAVLSAGIIALAVLLPQLVHMAAGPQGGMQWLPMYLPVLLGGCLLGPIWGLGVGVLAPLASFAVTSAMGNAMPAAARLPFMMAELAVFAAVSGAFSCSILSASSQRRSINSDFLYPLTPFTPCAFAISRRVAKGSVFNFSRIFYLLFSFTWGLSKDSSDRGLVHKQNFAFYYILNSRK